MLAANNENVNHHHFSILEHNFLRIQTRSGEKKKTHIYWAKHRYVPVISKHPTYIHEDLGDRCHTPQQQITTISVKKQRSCHTVATCSKSCSWYRKETEFEPSNPEASLKPPFVHGWSNFISPRWWNNLRNNLTWPPHFTNARNGTCAVLFRRQLASASTLLLSCGS